MRWWPRTRWSPMTCRRGRWWREARHASSGRSLPRTPGAARDRLAAEVLAIDREALRACRQLRGPHVVEEIRLVRDTVLAQDRRDPLHVVGIVARALRAPADGPDAPFGDAEQLVPCLRKVHHGPDAAGAVVELLPAARPRRSRNSRVVGVDADDVHHVVARVIAAQRNRPDA